MVVAKDSTPVDFVLIVEGTANMVAHWEDLKKFYIFPAIQHFNGFPPSASNYTGNYGCNKYSLILFHSSDRSPEPATECYPPIQNPWEFQKMLNSLQFYGGGYEKSSQISEGLGRALQLFDDMSATRYGVESKKICFLTCYSPPYDLPCFQTANYVGKTADDLTTLMGEKGIHLSLICPRILRPFRNLYDLANPTAPALVNYAQNNKHLVYISGFSLPTEREPTPLDQKSTEVQQIPNSEPVSTILPSPAQTSPAFSNNAMTSPSSQTPSSTAVVQTAATTMQNITDTSSIGNPVKSQPQQSPMNIISTQNPTSVAMSNPPSNQNQMMQQPVQQQMQNQVTTSDNLSTSIDNSFQSNNTTISNLFSTTTPNVNTNMNKPVNDGLSNLKKLLRPTQPQQPTSMTGGMNNNISTTNVSMFNSNTVDSNILQTTSQSQMQAPLTMQRDPNSNINVSMVNQMSNTGARMISTTSATQSNFGNVQNNNTGFNQMTQQQNVSSSNKMQFTNSGMMSGNNAMSQIQQTNALNQNNMQQMHGNQQQMNQPNQGMQQSMTANIGQGSMGQNTMGQNSMGQNTMSMSQNSIGQNTMVQNTMTIGQNSMVQNTMGQNTMSMGQNNMGQASIGDNVMGHQTSMPQQTPMGQVSMGQQMPDQHSGLNANNFEAAKKVADNVMQLVNSQNKPQPPMRLWAGQIKWEDKRKIPNPYNRVLQCEAFASPQHNFNEGNTNFKMWPQMLKMQLMPNSLVTNLPQIKQCKAMTLNLGPPEYVKLLEAVMSKGMMGLIHITPQELGSNECTVILIMYIAKKQTFYGLLPLNPNNFAHTIRQIILSRQRHHPNTNNPQQTPGVNNSHIMPKQMSMDGRFNNQQQSQIIRGQMPMTSQQMPNQGMQQQQNTMVMNNQQNVIRQGQNNSMIHQNRPQYGNMQSGAMGGMQQNQMQSNMMVNQQQNQNMNQQQTQQQNVYQNRQDPNQRNVQMQFMQDPIQIRNQRQGNMQHNTMNNTRMTGPSNDQQQLRHLLQNTPSGNMQGINTGMRQAAPNNMQRQQFQQQGMQAGMGGNRMMGIQQMQQPRYNGV